MRFGMGHLLMVEFKVGCYRQKAGSDVVGREEAGLTVDEGTVWVRERRDTDTQVTLNCRPPFRLLSHLDEHGRVGDVERGADRQDDLLVLLHNYEHFLVDVGVAVGEEADKEGHIVDLLQVRTNSADPSGQLGFVWHSPHLNPS